MEEEHEDRELVTLNGGEVMQGTAEVLPDAPPPSACSVSPAAAVAVAAGAVAAGAVCIPAIEKMVKGKRIRVSSGTSDEEEAKRKEAELVAVASIRGDADRLMAVEGMVRSKTEDADARERDMLRLEDCPAKFPHRRRDGSEVKPNTMRTALMAWGMFTSYCKGIGVETVAGVTAKAASDFILSMKPRMKELCFIYCRAMFSRIGVEPNPFSVKPVRRKAEHTHREPLSIEEVKTLLAKADSYAKHPKAANGKHRELAAFFRFLVYTGLRMGDAAAMKTSQVDFETMTITRFVTAKTDARVSFPLHPALADVLPRDGEYLFPKIAAVYLTSGGGPLSHRISRLFHAAGLADGFEPGERCAHSLRATFATMCCENLVPIEVIQSWLGHEAVFVTYIYTHFNDMDKKRDAVAKLPTL